MTDALEENVPNILIVDDTPANALLLARMLTLRGYHARAVHSGALALQAARLEPPDLFLLDIKMPEMDGYELCELLKADPLLEEIPVIFVSVLNETVDKVQGFRVGGVDFVTKPFQLEEVYARVEAHLRIRSLQRRLLEQQMKLQEFNGRLEERVEEEICKSRDKDLLVMRQEKLASLGQLAAGVAHEINNPIGYISSNLSVLAEYFEQIVEYDRICQEAGFGGLAPSIRESITKSRNSLRVEELLEDGVALIRESLVGAGRVTKIVRDLKNFSRADAVESEAVALTSCMDIALTIAHNELKYITTIRKEYESGEEILCHPGQLSQLFLNLLVNAGQSLSALKMGEIVLRSWHDDRCVFASVSDNGCGISEEVRERIFDPFFTTKDVGKGTGLGLSIAYDIISRHKGEIMVESVVDGGSTFTVKLPRIREAV